MRVDVEVLLILTHLTHALGEGRLALVVDLGCLAHCGDDGIRARLAGHVVFAVVHDRVLTRLVHVDDRAKFWEQTLDDRAKF